MELNMTKHDPGKKYVEEAKEELKILHRRIEEIEAKNAGSREEISAVAVGGQEINWNKVLNDFRTQANQIGSQLEKLGQKIKNVDMKDVSHNLEQLRSTSGQRLSESWERGSERWSDLQSIAETGFWDLRAALQRVSEGLRPLIHKRAEGEKTRYFLGKSHDGRWALVLQGADTPTMHFSNKSEGLKTSRRYVRE